MMAARTASLGDLITITRGKTYKSALLGLPGPVLLGLASIARNGGFRADSLRTYGGDSPANLLVRPGELFASLKDVTQSADLLGSVARVPVGGTTGRLTQDTVRLDVVSGEVDVGYLYLALLTPTYREYCKSHATGTTNLGLPRDDFLAYEIPLPPLDEQRRIAAVLGALDDLIETNGALVGNLLEAARQAFAISTFNDGRWSTYGEVAGVFGGGTPSTTVPDYWGGDINWTTPKDLTGLAAPFLFGSARRITAAGLNACASELHPPGSILMTSRAGIGTFAVATVPTAVNQGFIVVRPERPEDGTYLLFEMMTRVSDYLAHANGSTFLEISRGRFKALPILWPSQAARDLFHALAGPLVEAAIEAEREVSDLTRTRDELLPLLMSGRVRVSADLAVA